jgi:UDP-N-acetylmuramate dehydrogenase
MSGIHGILREGDEVIAYSGTSMADVGTFALSQSLSGLEFSSGLPGSVGGAVWMNARCYEKSISDVLVRTEVLETDGTIRTVATVPSEWGYKLSPFRKSGGVILRARFHLQSGAPEAIRSEMALRRADREAKGHFLHACAGSMFKNNRDFGAPTGKLIDSLGLKGRRIGDAVIPPYHGNFIVNLGNASARDVLSLIELIEGEVGGKLGFALEREVLLVGDWQAS